MQSFYSEVIAAIKKDGSADFNGLKIRLSKKYGLKKVPSDIEIFLNGKEEELKNLTLVTKPTRTLSGVATISIMTAPAGCPHGRCTFCPGGPDSFFGNVPQSYTGREPATMRAIRNAFDAYLQVFSRLEQYAVIGQSFDKIELIIQGGTFPSMDKSYQDLFIGLAYKAMNDFAEEFLTDGRLNLAKYKEFFELPGEYRNEERVQRVQKKMLSLKNSSEKVSGEKPDFVSDKVLERERKRNETAGIRCVGLTIETKPDWGMLEHGNQMLKLGCTRVELGIQSVFELPLKLTNRGHSLNDTIRSIRILKDLGLKINAHYMLGLPGVRREDELEGLRKLFADPDFKPDMLKIYPLLVMKGTPLYVQWERGQYNPISTDEAAEIISEAKRFVPKWVRIMRVNRDIPTKVTSAGIDRTNLRQYVRKLQEEKNIVCNCIRCREAGRNKKFENVQITVEEYEASKGKEFFVAAEDRENNVLLGFCRLRLPSQQLTEEISGETGIIRELHVYSSAVSIGNVPDGKQVQHRGYGKRLLEKAERLATDNGMKKMLVLSGIGAKEYYRKLGYRNEGIYVGKTL